MIGNNSADGMENNNLCSHESLVLLAPVEGERGTTMANVSAARMAYGRLMELYRTYAQLVQTTCFLEYDQMAYMPASAAPARSGVQFGVTNQMNNVCKLAVQQYKFAEPGIRRGEFDQFELANLREAHRVMWATRDLKLEDQQRYIYSIQAKQNKQNTFLMLWPRLKATKDWAQFSEHLRGILAASVDVATYISRGRTPYDNMIADHAYGVTYADVLATNDELLTWWPSLRDAVRAAQADEDRKLGEPILPKAIEADPENLDAKTAALLRQVLTMTRFDWSRGRIDTALHPLTSSPSFDTRVTYSRAIRDPLVALTQAFHEAGHAAYEQGVPSHMWHLPIGVTDCKAFHEGHSHFVEMCILRDPKFSEVVASLLKDTYGDDPAYDVSNLKRLMKRVSTAPMASSQEPRPISSTIGDKWAAAGVRDDVAQLPNTIIHTRLEQELVTNEIKVADAPSRLRDLIRQYHGAELSEAQAQAQLMENSIFPSGAFGMLPAYVMGIQYACHIDAALRRDIGTSEVDDALSAGVLAPLLGWLADRLWSRGRIHETQRELVEEATATKLTSASFQTFLEKRYVPN
jgi:carboxypeptidase Taq